MALDSAWAVGGSLGAHGGGQGGVLLSGRAPDEREWHTCRRRLRPSELMQWHTMQLPGVGAAGGV